MRKILLSLLVMTGCVVGTNDGGGGGGADDTTGGGGDDQQPQPNPDPTTQGAVCSLPAATADVGDLAAVKAQQCNVPGSAGTKKWYRVAATLPGSMDFVQLELWDGRGAFSGGTVALGTYQLTGAELDPATCGICVRGLGDKGAATQKEYFATAGQVQVTAVGGNGLPVSVTLTDVSFKEINPTSKASVAGGCSATVSRAKLDGTIVAVTGGGGGGACPTTIGD
jgi:hypothetical protein